uniref:Tyrosinase copper-binding domain-containing protein n=1 Tax=Acrobeloides nanus TaxID=290746 RepID=A0A914EJ37_9BILA
MRFDFVPNWDVPEEITEEDKVVRKILKDNYTSEAWRCMNLTCLCPYFDGRIENSTNKCILPSGKILTKSIRREYRTLSDEERNIYHKAVRNLMENGLFDEISMVHYRVVSINEAHSKPEFWIWHRHYIKSLEIELRKINPEISLPYWDSTMDQNLPNSHDSIMWTDEFIGRTDENGTVISGPGAYWVTLNGHLLTRRTNFKSFGLFHEADIKYVLGESQLGMPRRPKIDNCGKQLEFLEIMHGDPHHYVGGAMDALITAANDPIFFLHHCFVDLIWELWRQQKNPNCHLIGLIDDDIDETYEYAPRPTCTKESPNCGSKYLFCDQSKKLPQCSVKVQLGGICKGLKNENQPCISEQCIEGICQYKPFKS